MEVLHTRCAGLDVHKDTVVAAIRLAEGGAVQSEVRTFGTATPDLLALSDWLAEHDCTYVAMEATGVYWRPVWHILSDGDRSLVLANAAHVKNVPGRKTDVADAVWLARAETLAGQGMRVLALAGRRLPLSALSEQASADEVERGLTMVDGVLLLVDASEGPLPQTRFPN